MTLPLNIQSKNTSISRSLFGNSQYEPQVWKIIKEFNPKDFLSVHYVFGLLGKMTPISSGNDLGNLLLSTIRNTDKKSLNSLMDLNRVFKTVIIDPNFTNIPLSLLERIYIAACTCGLTPIVQTLMKNQRFKEIPAASFGLALTEAAQNRHTNLAKHLIESPRFNHIGSHSVIKALKHAVSNHDTELVRLFLCNGNCLHYDLRSVLDIANLHLNKAKKEEQTAFPNNKKFSGIIGHLDQIIAMLTKKIRTSFSY
jgi:hypothetical protein